MFFGAEIDKRLRPLYCGIFAVFRGIRQIFAVFCLKNANFCGKIAGMEKSTLQTAAIIATIVAAAWMLGGQVQALGGQVRANSAAIGELREDVRELRGLLVSHIAGHPHSEKVAVVESGADGQ